MDKLENVETQRLASWNWPWNGIIWLYNVGTLRMEYLPIYHAEGLSSMKVACSARQTYSEVQPLSKASTKIMFYILWSISSQKMCKWQNLFAIQPSHFHPSTQIGIIRRAQLSLWLVTVSAKCIQIEDCLFDVIHRNRLISRQWRGFPHRLTMAEVAYCIACHQLAPITAFRASFGVVAQLLGPHWCP